MATKIKTSKVSVSVKNLRSRYEKTDFSLAIQRNEVWDLNRKSLLLHSFLQGFPVPAVYARKLDNSDIDYMLDGKQRLTTLFGFVKQGDVLKDKKTGEKIPLLGEDNEPVTENGKPAYQKWPGFALQNVPPVTYIDEANNDAEIEVDVNGMKFLDLPEPLRDGLLGEMVSITRFENMTDEEQDEMFLRLNNGMPLRTIETIRAIAGQGVMKFIDEVADSNFFANSVAITDKARERFTDDESVLQVLSLVYYAGTDTIPGFSGDETKAFANLLREIGGFPDDKAAIVRDVVGYLALAFPHKESTLKKVHIPSLVLVAIEAKKRGISTEKFGGYWQEFMAKRYKVGTAYGVAASRGSAKKENVSRRVDEMMKDFEKHIATAPNYTEPKKVQNERAKALEAEKARLEAEAAKKAEDEKTLAGVGAGTDQQG